MEKVMVIGCPGSGKSTFARELHAIFDLPLFYLDVLWHNEDKTNVTLEEFDSKLAKILNKKDWIIDGNYSRTMSIRLKEADTIFFLDYPLDVCLAGAESRIGKVREDLPWVETEFDEEFKQWILNFSTVQRPVIKQKLEDEGCNKTIYTFKSRQEASAYLEKVRREFE